MPLMAVLPDAQTWMPTGTPVGAALIDTNLVNLINNWFAANASQSSTTNVTISTSGTVGTANVTFATPFSATPNIVVSVANVGAPGLYAASFGNASTTGFTIYLNRTSGTGTFQVSWIANLPTQ